MEFCLFQVSEFFYFKNAATNTIFLGRVVESGDCQWLVEGLVPFSTENDAAEGDDPTVQAAIHLGDVDDSHPATCCVDESVDDVLLILKQPERIDQNFVWPV